MKKFILITSLLCGHFLKMMAAIDPVITYSFPSFFNAIVTYTYDDAGNIIKKSHHWILTTQGTTEEDSDVYSFKGEFDISITADYSWEHVSIEITGNVDAEGGLLEVYNMSGMNVYKAKMSSNCTSINLSSLNKGVYIFRIGIGDSILIKH
ncbi:MAG: T9SS type A sorting domain-containing protein [Bacteroidaceae bacterium]|nr:T9SS type A sorting domain-containing protein [Bacteroidaceae bacterium]